jgi:ActR/RegA family two-component response regulator
MAATLPSSNIDILLKDKVVIMEDDPDLQEQIKGVMRKEYDWDVIVANSLDEVTHIAENNEAAYYIFDVHMGTDRDSEGLDALETVKHINDKSFVTIFTAHPRFQKQAVKAGADFSLKKSIYLDNDINRIANEMLLHRIKIENETTENIEQLKEIYEKLYKISHPDGLDDDNSSDKNIAAYEQLKSDPEWFETHKDKYVAFVDGEFVRSDPDRETLLDWLIEAEEYQDKNRYFTKIEAEDRIIDEPTSSWLDIVYEGDES